MNRHASFITRGSLAGPGRRPAPADVAEETCDLCGEAIPHDHRHLLEVETRRAICVCRACSILFDRSEASEGRFRLMSERRLSLPNFAMDDVRWESLRIPVNLAFLFYSTPAERVVALYPSPVGATESLLQMETWGEIESANPVLQGMTPDVESLLIDRTRDDAQYYLVPIEDCFRLVAIIRTKWRGLSGGSDVWSAVEEFFDDLGRRAMVIEHQS